MIAQRRREFLAGLGGAMLATGGACDSALDPTRSAEGFLLPPAVHRVAGVGPTFPVWIHDDRVTTSRTFGPHYHERENDPGIAVLLYGALADQTTPWLQWETVTAHTQQLHSFSERRLPEIMRVVDARTGRVVFSSGFPEPILRSARWVVDRLPKTYGRDARLACGDRGDLSLFYDASGVAPYEEYLEKRPLAASRAVAYRNYLRRYSEQAALIKVLSPDFFQWFSWHSDVPELPDPERMCGDDGDLWTLLLDSYL
jgi:hypothetical protein